MSYDEGEHTKEVFAHFGLAYYLSGVFEAGITNGLLLLDFLAAQADQLRQGGRKNFDRGKFEREFDTFLDRQYAKTLGNLIKRIHELTGMDQSLKDAIAAAKVRRNYLAHHFFREHAEDFARRTGRDKMLEELAQAQAEFESVDQRISAYVRTATEKMGLKTDGMEAYVEQYIKAVHDEESQMPPTERGSHAV
jgi:hypothetical protein